MVTFSLSLAMLNACNRIHTSTNAVAASGLLPSRRRVDERQISYCQAHSEFLENMPVSSCCDALLLLLYVAHMCHDWLQMVRHSCRRGRFLHNMRSRQGRERQVKAPLHCIACRGRPSSPCADLPQVWVGPSIDQEHGLEGQLNNMQAQVAALQIMRMQAQALADLMANFLHDLRGEASSTPTLPHHYLVLSTQVSRYQVPLPQGCRSYLIWRWDLFIAIWSYGNMILWALSGDHHSPSATAFPGGKCLCRCLFELCICTACYSPPHRNARQSQAIQQVYVCYAFHHVSRSF